MQAAVRVLLVLLVVGGCVVFVSESVSGSLFPTRIPDDPQWLDNPYSMAKRVLDNHMLYTQKSDNVYEFGGELFVLQPDGSVFRVGVTKQKPGTSNEIWSRASWDTKKNTPHSDLRLTVDDQKAILGLQETDVPNEFSRDGFEGRYVLQNDNTFFYTGGQGRRAYVRPGTLPEGGYPLARANGQQDWDYTRNTPLSTAKLSTNDEEKGSEVTSAEDTRTSQNKLEVNIEIEEKLLELIENLRKAIDEEDKSEIVRLKNEITKTAQGIDDITDNYILATLNGLDRNSDTPPPPATSEAPADSADPPPPATSEAPADSADPPPPATSEAPPDSPDSPPQLTFEQFRAQQTKFDEARAELNKAIAGGNVDEIEKQLKAINEIDLPNKPPDSFTTDEQKADFTSTREAIQHIKENVKIQNSVFIYTQSQTDNSPQTTTYREITGTGANRKLAEDSIVVTGGDNPTAQFQIENGPSVNLVVRDREDTASVLPAQRITQAFQVARFASEVRSPEVEFKVEKGGFTINKIAETPSHNWGFLAGTTGGMTHVVSDDGNQITTTTRDGTQRITDLGTGTITYQDSTGNEIMRYETAPSPTRDKSLIQPADRRRVIINDQEFTTNHMASVGGTEMLGSLSRDMFISQDGNTVAIGVGPGEKIFTKSNSIFSPGFRDQDGNPMTPQQREQYEKLQQAIQEERRKRQINELCAQPMGCPTTEQQIFAGISVAHSGATSFRSYSSLFMSKEDLVAWRQSVDELFATLHLGSQYWASTLCAANLRQPSGQQVAFSLGPNPYGKQTDIQVAATCSGERQTIIDPFGQTQYLYKITYYVRNTGTHTMSYNVELTGERTVQLRERDVDIKPGETSTRSGRNAFVQYSTTRYDTCCVQLTNAPRLINSPNRICNRIIEADTTPTTVSGPPASGSQSQGAPGAVGFNTI